MSTITMVRILVVLLVLILEPIFSVAGVPSDKLPDKMHPAERALLGIIDPRLLPIGYCGQEKLVYDISWTGGLKIGELYLNVNALPGTKDDFEIRARVTTKNGAINLIYPVEDLHVTKVRGEKRLPYHYEVWQREGFNYRAHRMLDYNQDTGYIRYMKNDRLEGEYHVGGEINNEFSSFFNSRLMAFDIGEQFVVPTFADKRRVEVVVHAVSLKRLDKTILGPVETVAIMPIMNFKGLYDKKGDTVIWYTNDECRVPVRVNSKIVIGSLTADLTEYVNPACTRYPALKK